MIEQQYVYKGVRVGLCKAPRTPEGIFQRHGSRSTLRVCVIDHWCGVEIKRHDATYSYALRSDNRAYFPRYVLVQGDQCELLNFEATQLLRDAKDSFVSTTLPDGLVGFPTYLDALAEHIMSKDTQLHAVEDSMHSSLLAAGFKPGNWP